MDSGSIRGESAMNPHKRFLVMTDDQYYPSAGTGSILESFGTLEEAIKFADQPHKYWDYVEIFDCDKRQTVWEKD